MYCLFTMLRIIEKTVDPQGRVLLPKEWRQKYGKKLLLFEVGEELHLMPKKHKKLSDLIEIDVDIKNSLSDWHNVEKELRRKI